MSVQTQEARIILAIEVIGTTKNMSRRPAARIYNIPKTTLRNRINGITRIARHPSSSPTPIVAAADRLSKEMQPVSHRIILLEAEVRTLPEANEALSKRRRAKRTRLRDGWAMNGDQARDIIAEKGVVDKEGRVEEENEGSSKRRRANLRLVASFARLATMQGHAQRLEKWIVHAILSSFN